jgi:hypothetical protein
MKNLFILFGFIGFVLTLGTSADAQTRISFDKGAFSKTLTVTVPAKSEKQYSVLVKKNQVINVTVSGDINVSKNIEFPAISLNLVNGQDGEGYLSVLTGTDGHFIFSVSNSSNRPRTFKMRVSVTDDHDDYMGGID